MALPRHVAIIMDGNGRWAQARGRPRTAGHEAGAESVRAITTACRELGVEVLTLYSFSTENWKRPKDEVARLMALLADYVREQRAELFRHHIRLRVIGDLERLPVFVRGPLRALCEDTTGHRGMTLCLALSYGGRDEIVRAARTLATEAAAGRLRPDDLDEARFQAALDTTDLPEVDLLIRTSGELRVSNFLLWQIAYAELYVTDVHWPDFRRADLEAAFQAFGRRERRRGRTGAQLQAEGS